MKTLNLLTIIAGLGLILAPMSCADKKDKKKGDKPANENDNGKGESGNNQDGGTGSEDAVKSTNQLAIIQTGTGERFALFAVKTEDTTLEPLGAELDGKKITTDLEGFKGAQILKGKISKESVKKLFTQLPTEDAAQYRSTLISDYQGSAYFYVENQADVFSSTEKLVVKMILGKDGKRVGIYEFTINEPSSLPDQPPADDLDPPDSDFGFENE